MKKEKLHDVISEKEPENIIIEFPDMCTGEMMEVRLSPHEKLGDTKKNDDLVHIDYDELFDWIDWID